MLSIELKYLGFYFFTNCILFCSAQIITPCKMNDYSCMTKSAKSALPLIVAGIPSLGVESADPLHVDKIIGDLSILKYNFTDSTITGMKECDINNVQLNMETSNLHFDLKCPLSFKGNYIITGRLIILPVEGSGKYSIDAKKYSIGVDCDVKTAQGKDGKSHLKINSFKLKLEALESVKYHFENLFNGRKDLSDTVHQFANENWKEVADLVQEPVFIGQFKKITSILNKYFKSIPFDDLFIP